MGHLPCRTHLRGRHRHLPVVREKMDNPVGFRDTVKRLLAAWSEGINPLRDSRLPYYIHQSTNSAR
jgi:hypothetical protein